MGNVKNVLATSLLCLCLSGCWTTREGQKTGLIVKVAKEGIFWGTYEGELIRGGFDSGSGSSGMPFKFTLGQFKNKNIEEALEIMGKNKPVTIKYHCELFVAPWRGHEGCFLDGIDKH